jgi:hypothetical protein
VKVRTHVDVRIASGDAPGNVGARTCWREAKLSYMGHVVMEKRNGLAVSGMVTQANGTAEREASKAMLKVKAKCARRRITVGEDKAYDTQDHVAALRNIGVTPHMAQNDTATKTGKRRRSVIDRRTTRRSAMPSPRPAARWSNASSAGASSTSALMAPTGP